MNKRYRLCDVEEAVSESEVLIDIADDIAEIDEDMQLVISGWAVYIESLNLTLGLIVMVLYKPRTWCTFCPMGTMTQGVCKLKNNENK